MIVSQEPHAVSRRVLCLPRTGAGGKAPGLRLRTRLVTTPELSPQVPSQHGGESCSLESPQAKWHFEALQAELFFRKHAEVTLKSLSGSWRARIHFVESRSWRTPQGTNPLAYPHFHRFVWHGVAKDFKREITYGTSNHWRATFCSNHLASCLGTDAGVRGLPYLMRYVNQPDGSSTSCREFFVLRFTGTWLTKLL